MDLDASRALLEAVAAGDSGKVKTLLRLDADPDLLNEALFLAVGSDHLPVLGALLEQGLPPETLTQPLEIAARDGQNEAVKMLLAAGADVNAGAGAALAAAAEFGRADTVKMLLQAGADLSAGDGKALIMAAGMGETDVVALLLQSGARNIDAALEAAKFSGQNDETIRVISAWKSRLGPPGFRSPAPRP